jgi:hypothetical protein
MSSSNHGGLSWGVYTPDQAARLLRLRADVVHRWVYGGDTGDAALIPFDPSFRGEFVTFIDLIQSMAVREIRNTHRLSLQKIRQSVEAARKHGIEYPFARKHRAYAFHDDVVIRLDDGRLVQITGKYKENQLIEPVVYPFLDDLGFDDRGLANLYEPMKRGFRRVALTPSRSFGAPVILPSGYLVKTLVNAFYAEGGVDAAARICDVHQDDITLAVEYEKSLSHIPRRVAA